MPKTTVRWITGQQFVGLDSNNHAVVLSGEGQPNGLRPSQLLLIALASCTAVDVIEILAKKRKPLSFLEIITDGEHDEEPPWPYRKIHVLYRVGGKGLTEKAIRQAIDLSEKKYCSVSATVRGVAEITTDFEIVAVD
ncbi:MAG: OsmC family protein [Desulfobacterales bacterium]|jgi:putative redox protein